MIAGDQNLITKHFSPTQKVDTTEEKKSTSIINTSSKGSMHVSVPRSSEIASSSNYSMTQKGSTETEHTPETQPDAQGPA